MLLHTRRAEPWWIAPLRISLGHKLLCALALVTGFDFDFDYEQALACRLPGMRAPSGFLAPRLACWDAEHYLHISINGYQAGSSSCAFYPLWPLLIRLSSPADPDWRPLIAAGLANVMSLLASVFLFRLISIRFGFEIARDSLLLLFAFPGALFLFFPYTESLFLLIVSLFFLGLSGKRRWLAFAAGFLAPLAKAIGLFLLLPLSWNLWSSRRLPRLWPLLTAPIAGALAYGMVMLSETGNPLEGYLAQRFYPNAPSILNAIDIAGAISAFCTVNTFAGMMDGALDRALFMLCLVFLPALFRLDKTWFCYALAAGVIPALTNWFISYRRYFIVCFPIFVALAIVHRGRRLRGVFYFYIIVLTCIQIWGVIQFSRFKWAG